MSSLRRERIDEITDRQLEPDTEARSLRDPEAIGPAEPDEPADLGIPMPRLAAAGA